MIQPALRIIQMIAKLVRQNIAKSRANPAQAKKTEQQIMQAKKDLAKAEKNVYAEMRKKKNVPFKDLPKQERELLNNLNRSKADLKEFERKFKTPSGK